MKSERFEMRLDATTVSRVDAWREKQADAPSRAEAFRRLVDVGLAVASADEFYPSNTEKLMLFMLADLMKGCQNSTEIDPEFVSDVVAGGHYWALGWKYNGVFHDHFDSPAQVRLVVDILTMWSDIEFAVARLSESEQKTLEEMPNIVSTQFIGFDGNEETEYMCIAELMMSKLRRFESLSRPSNDLNSHWPTIDTHVRMLKEYSRIKPALTGRVLTLKELVEILSY